MLNRNTYNIGRVADGQAGSQLLTERVFKGVNVITFNFNFPVATNEVIKLKISHNGSTLALFQRSAIPSSYQSTVTPSPIDYLTKEHFQITITYDNFNTYDFVAPIQIAQTSYYKDLDGLSVKNAQFIDTSDNGDMLIIMQNDANDAYNIILHANEQIATPISAIEVDVLAALSTNLVTVSAIETDVEQNIEVLH